MDIGVISVRYARALLKGSCDAKIEDKVYLEMQLLAKSYIEVPRLRFTIDNPMISKANKESLLVAAVGGAPCELTKAFFRLVLKEDRESVIHIIRGKLTTAAAVSPVTERRLQQMVEDKTNGTVEFETEVNPDIIGGFVLEYDTFRMDASVKTKLKSILSQLKM